MFLVFCALKIVYICVFMTCSTSNFLCDTPMGPLNVCMHICMYVYVRMYNCMCMLSTGEVGRQGFCSAYRQRRADDGFKTDGSALV
jgi:hypothetical protein